MVRLGGSRVRYSVLSQHAENPGKDASETNLRFFSAMASLTTSCSHHPTMMICTWVKRGCASTLDSGTQLNISVTECELVIIIPVRSSRTRVRNLRERTLERRFGSQSFASSMPVLSTLIVMCNIERLSFRERVRCDGTSDI